jgi:hypothetical protein
LAFETEYGELCRAKEATIEKLQSYWNRTKSQVYYFAVLLYPRLKKRFYIAKKESGLVDQSELDHVELLLDTLRQYCEDNSSKQRQMLNLKMIFLDLSAIKKTMKWILTSHMLFKIKTVIL